MPMIATTANGQPAFGLYMRTREGDFVPFHLQVLDLDGDRVRHVGAFFEQRAVREVRAARPAARRLRPGRHGLTAMAALDHAVELLDRALAYTRVTLDRRDRRRPAAAVRRASAGTSASCSRTWRTPSTPSPRAPAARSTSTTAPPREARVDEPAGEGVRAARRVEQPGPVDACASASTRPRHPLVVAAAALEITVHGWDVGRAIGSDRPDPGRLAAGLLPVARGAGHGRPTAARSSSAPRPVPAEAPADLRLLGFLGRDAYPPTGSTDPMANSWQYRYRRRRRFLAFGPCTSKASPRSIATTPRPVGRRVAPWCARARSARRSPCSTCSATRRPSACSATAERALLSASLLECRLARGDLAGAMALGHAAGRAPRDGAGRRRSPTTPAVSSPRRSGTPSSPSATSRRSPRTPPSDPVYPELLPWRAGAALALLRLGRRPRGRATWPGEHHDAGASPTARRTPSRVALRTLAATVTGDRRVELLREARDRAGRGPGRAPGRPDRHRPRRRCSC